METWDAIRNESDHAPTTRRPGTDHIGIVGLAAMGRGIALNLADHGFEVAVHNRTLERMRSFLDEHGDTGSMVGCESLEQLVERLDTPRVVLLMVSAGAVDDVLAELMPLLDPGDIVMDGGNSHFADTRRRAADATANDLLYVGVGISGGESGARHGPSIMPGGTPAAWPVIAPMLQAIAARAPDGSPCCDWIGSDGAGHFVKMVHNGIEYGEMQALAEAYDALSARGLSNDEMADIFEDWNDGVLESYLVEIAAEVLRYRDEDRGGEATIDAILDAAEQKGTGRWTAIEAFDLGAVATVTAEAVASRSLSAQRERRRAASAALPSPTPPVDGVSADDLADAVLGTRLVGYAQGCDLIAAGSREYGWELDLPRIMEIWREGCIIRARLLDDLAAALRSSPDDPLLDRPIVALFDAAQDGWRRAVRGLVAAGIPAPAVSSAIAYYDGHRRARLPANLLQALRDRFGAHTYRRLDDPDGDDHHTDWVG